MRAIGPAQTSAVITRMHDHACGDHALGRRVSAGVPALRWATVHDHGPLTGNCMIAEWGWGHFD